MLPAMYSPTTPEAREEEDEDDDGDGYGYEETGALVLYFCVGQLGVGGDWLGVVGVSVESDI